jgi:hypothetical protein
VARPLDLSQTEAQVSGTRNLLISARRDVLNARELLVLFTGAPEVFDARPRRLVRPPAADPDAGFVSGRRAARRGWISRRRVGDRGGAASGRGRVRPVLSVGFAQPDGLPLSRIGPVGPRLGSALDSEPADLFRGRIRADVREAWSFFREALLVRSYLLRQVAHRSPRLS